MSKTMLTGDDKVIFLDVDGVLHSAYTDGATFDAERMMLLKELVEKTRAKLVLSSSWREFPSMLKQVVKHLKEYGLELYSTTPVGCSDRPLEIFDWLNQHAPESNYVVLDDWDMSDYFKEKMICTSGPGYSGMRRDDIEKAIRVLNG